jgi:hypothetical protein
MSALTMFVDKENAFARVFGREPYDLQSANDRQRIADRIDSQLSPENLTCDGELSAAEVNRRYKLLMGAARELVRLDSSVRIYELS